MKVITINESLESGCSITLPLSRVCNNEVNSRFGVSNFIAIGNKFHGRDNKEFVERFRITEWYLKGIIDIIDKNVDFYIYDNFIPNGWRKHKTIKLI